MMSYTIDFGRGLDILLSILSISLALCFIRLFLGPTIPNRTVAFDSIAIHAVAISALFAIRIDAPSMLDVTIVVAILGFLGTTMLARYLERSAPLYFALKQRQLDEEQELQEKVIEVETGMSAVESEGNV